MRRLRWGPLLSVAFLAVALLVFGQRLLGAPVGAIRTVSFPVARLIETGGRSVGDLLRSFASVGTLAHRVRTTETEVARLQGELARKESVERENQELRRALDLPPTSTARLIAAEVVGVTTDGAITALHINRGSRHGATQGNPVIAPGGFVVGTVREAAWGTAIVDLPMGGSLRIAARALGSGAEGVIRGLHGLEVVLEGVPRGQELKTGDHLITTGLDGVFPPHLFVGTIETVRAPENAIFQEASIRLPWNPQSLRIVTVMSSL